MAFKFNLQKALDYREQLEDEAKARLGKAERDLAQAETKLRKLEGQLLEETQKIAGKVMQSGERWLHDQYIKGIAGDVKEASLQARMSAQIVEDAKRALAARSMDRKILDKLKERKRLAYNKDEQKREQKFNDEIATSRHKAAAF